MNKNAYPKQLTQLIKAEETAINAKSGEIRCILFVKFLLFQIYKIFSSASIIEHCTNIEIECILYAVKVYTEILIP